MGFKQSEALKTIERLDLWNEQAGWEIHTLSTFNNEMTKQLRPKGCFVMYNLDEFDFSAIAHEAEGSSLADCDDKVEEEKDDMQIDSSPGIKKDKQNDDTALFHKNAIKYGLRDKIIIFGGW